MDPIKPGTRLKYLGQCQCNDPRCTNVNSAHGFDHPDAYQCHEDAVRMVTVGNKWLEGDSNDKVPMCAACADFHEKGGPK